MDEKTFNITINTNGCKDDSPNKIAEKIIEGIKNLEKVNEMTMQEKLEKEARELTNKLSTYRELDDLKLYLQTLDALKELNNLLYL